MTDDVKAANAALVESENLRAQLREAAERLDEFGSQPTLADGIQAMRLRLVDLRARVAELENHAHECINDNADLVVRAEKAEARVKEAEARVAELEAGLKALEEINAGLARERDEARERVAELEGDLAHAMKSAERITEVTGRTTACLGGFPMETLVEAVERVVRERDALRARAAELEAALADHRARSIEQVNAAHAEASRFQRMVVAAGAERDRFAHEADELRSSVGTLKAHLSAAMERAKKAEARVAELEAGLKALEEINAALAREHTRAVLAKHPEGGR